MITNGIMTDPDRGQEEEVSLPVLHLSQGGKKVVLAAFAGDAISLALARGAPMFIEEECFMRGIESEKVKELLEIIGAAVPGIFED